MKFAVVTHGTRDPIPVDYQQKLQDAFSKIMIYFKQQNLDLIIHNGASSGMPAATAWTAGGRCMLAYHDSALSVRNSPWNYILFLLAHEFGHNYWPPEAIVPAYAAERLMRKGGRRARSPGALNAMMDVIVNAHLMREDGLREIIGVTGKELTRVKFQAENQIDISRSSYVGSTFVDWHIWAYQGLSQAPDRNAELVQLLQFFIDQPSMQKVPLWKDEFYQKWMRLLELYA